MLQKQLKKDMSGGRAAESLHQGVFMDAGDFEPCLSALLPSAPMCPSPCSCCSAGKELGFTGGICFLHALLAHQSMLKPLG